jgi:fibronectin type 3 domain-containing protein
MPTYESSGQLTTIEQSFNTPQTPDLSGLVYTLNGETISVDVVGSPGQAGEEIVTQSLTGASSYGLSWSNSHTDFEVVFDLSTADDSVTPEVDDLTLQGLGAPQNLAISDSATEDELSLTWDEEPQAEEYRIYRAQSSGSTLGDYTQIDTTTTVGYTDTGLEDGERYYYRVTAWASAPGETDPSNEADAITVLPAPTLSLDASVEDEITVSYTFTDDSGDGDLLLERSSDGGSTWTTAATVTTLSNGSYTDTGLNDGTTYTYRGTRNTDHASSVSGTPAATTILPAASGLSASDVRTTEVDLSWVVNADSGTQSVEYKESSASSWTTFSSGLALTTSAETVTGLSPGTSYDFRVGTTTTDAGTVYSGTYTTTTAPPAPAGLTVTEVTDTPDVSLSWTDVSGEDNYNIYRATSPGSTLADYTLIDSVTSNTTTYTDTGVSLGTRYYYRISAENTNGESTGSNEVRAEPNADDLTESIGWSVAREWQYGAFGSGTELSGDSVVIAPVEETTFDYDLDSDGSNTASASVAVIDQRTGNTLASKFADGDQFTDTPEQDSGTITIDTATHPELTLEASADGTDSSNYTGSSSASITGPDGTTASVNTITTETEQVDVEYANQTAQYETEVWDYTNTTTTSKITTTSTFNDTSESITLTVTPASATTTAQVSLSGGTESFLVDPGADDRYSIVADFDIGSDARDSPSLDSLTLETHTPPSNLTISETSQGDGFNLTWDGVSVADAYQVYRSTTTPVTTNDTLVTETTNTSYSDTSVDVGVDYYYNVRGVYSGE